jgi:hypothetical protein
MGIAEFIIGRAFARPVGSIHPTPFATTDVEEIVPDELFDAVAEVLVWVKNNRHLLYAGPLDHGVIDMDAGDHQSKNRESGSGSAASRM